MTVLEQLTNAAYHSIYLALLWAVILPFELLWPVREVKLSQRKFHLIYVLVTAPLVLTMVRVAFPVGFFQLNSATEVPSFIPVIDLSWIFNRLPYPVFFVRLLLLLAGDFCFYWWHRALHRIPLLWPMHKLHHLDRELNSLTTGLVHFFEPPITALLFTLAAPWIYACAGQPPLRAGDLVEEILLFLLAQKLYFWISHANWKIPFGPLTRVIVGPQVHHIHHSVEARYADKNYASVFPIWDILFGTYVHPGKEWPAEVGINGEPQVKNQLQALTLPFVLWRNLLKRRPRPAL